MPAPDVEAVVVGAGVAGLAAAHELTRAGVACCVVDASDRPGGVVRTDRVAGYLVERGPNTIMVKGPARAFLQPLGVLSSLLRAAPESQRRSIFHEGHLQAVPSSLASAIRTPLLSGRGKARLLTEPFVGRGEGSQESVAEFATRRFGREVSEKLVAPFLTGVYAGDETQLGAGAVFPNLVAMEGRHGSVLRGAVARLFEGGRRDPGLRGLHSTANGLGELVAELATRLPEAICLRTRVASLRREGAVWRLELETPEAGRELSARRVILATTADEASALLEKLDAEAAGLLAGISYAPIVGISLGVRRGTTAEPIEGFGFLVPRAARLDLLGCLFMSRLFANRAPPEHELLTCMLGGTRWPEAIATDDTALRSRLRGDLERTVGLREEPETLAVTRWPRAIPQPDRGHVARIARLRERAALQPGLALAGAYLDGVAVGDALLSGVRAARELAEARAS